MAPHQFMAHLAQAYRTFTASEAERASACFCLMLDNWRRVREQYGYSGLLSLLEKVRGTALETLGQDVEACVLNERTVLLCVPDCSLKYAKPLAAKLFQRLDSEAFEIDEDTAALSFSLGYCEFDHRFTDIDRLLVELVDGTQETTLAGGNAVTAITPDVSMGQASQSERQMLGLLMESLRKDSLRVFFQPIMSTSEESTKTFQILPRLVTADDTLVPAASFVPVARKARVLGVLDRWMIQRAVELLADRYHLQPVCLFLSQGDSLLVQPARREWLRLLLAKSPSVGERMVLDFAIDDALSNLKGTSEFMRLADELGVKICFSRVDEHSKWDLLGGRLRADYIRMSPEFVERLRQDERLEHLFRDLSGPVRKQGTKIIMPMVEDASVAANLWRTGTDYMQGYMIEKETEHLELGEY